jgi:hypothetical protein
VLLRRSAFCYDRPMRLRATPMLSARPALAAAVGALVTKKATTTTT